MSGNDPRYSRVNRKKMRNKSNQLLNIMIGLVVVLIIIVGASIIVGNDDEGKESAADTDLEETNETNPADEESQLNEESADSNAEDENASAESVDEESDDAGQTSEDSNGAGVSDSKDEGMSDRDTLTVVPGNDGIIAETVIDPSWQPIGTTQTGVHESKYDGESVDWNEKKKAISYATGHSEGELIFWKIKNGGGPQKSIGIVSTRDKSEKYRVFLEWVDGEGWKPVQMDILNTLDFDY